MAAFDDSDDIKITTSLDTEGAVKAAQDLKASIENAIKATAGQFDQLQKASKQLASVLKDQGAKELADTKAKLDQEVKATADAGRQEVAIAQQTANAKVDVVEKAIKKTISAEQRRIQELKVAARQEIELEKTKRTQMLKDIAQLNKERAIIRKTPRSELPPELGGIDGTGKLADAFSKTLAGMSVQLGNVNIGLGTFINNFKQLGIGGAAIASLTAVVSLIRQFDQEIDRLAAVASKVEGLRAGFETLQRTVGQDPSQSINKLREATQGLISDVDLYQRANQAVLLGVPTEIFNQAAAAAVKLGRAMGIDASFGLESLSLGLGRQSRLYLDNLGIVVSAEEAYQRFAASVGKSAQDLTDAEKRAAFFAEALRKIKERAEELPDPLDSVGISLQKLQVAQANADQRFSEGFNSSSLLTKAYQEQAKTTQQSIAINERFGQASGAVAGVTKNLANVIRDFGLVSKIAFSDFVDIFADFTPQEQLATTEARIEKLKVSINGLRESRSKADLGPTLTKRLKEEEEALRKAEEEAEKLRQKIAELRGEAQNPIKINVDLSEITQAQNEFKNFFATLKQEASEAGGRIEVPGISADTINEVSNAYENLYLKQLQGKLTQEQFNAEFAKIEQPIALTSNVEKIQEYAKQVSNLTEQIKSGKGDTTELNANLEIASQKYEAAKDAAGLYGKQIGQIGKVLKNAENAAKKTFSEIQKRQTTATKSVEKAQDRFESFVKSLRRTIGTALPDNFQKELVEIFNNGALSVADFEAALTDLARRAKDAGVDLEALKKEISDLQKLSEKGIKISIDADTTKVSEAYNEELARIQQQAGGINIRDILFGEEKDATGKKAGGGFFGFDLSSIDLQGEAAIANEVQNVLATAFQAGVDGFSREDAPAIGKAVGSVIGAVIGAFVGDPATGAQIGGIVGEIGGMIAMGLGKDKPGTRERKAIDEYFAELFDGERLAVVLTGQITGAIDQSTGQAIRDFSPQLARISDLTFEGMTAMAGNVDFGGEGFSSYFETLSTDVQAAFNGIGIAFGKLNGIASEEARLIGIALANNIGGSLQNLQVLIQATGESFDDLAKAVLDSFLDAQLTIEEAYNSLVQLQNLYGVGIPNAVGAYQEAIDNLNASLQDDAPGRYAIDSLRDIGAEGIEAGKAFDSVISSLAQTFNFTADQQARLFEALRINGITSLQQLQNASNEQLLAILRNVQLIRENAQAPLVTTPTTTFEKPSGGGRPSGPRKKSPEEEREERLKKLREETEKLLRESTKYADILKRLTDGELTSAAAGEAIVAAQQEITELIKTRNRLEREYEDLLKKGAKANKQRLAEVAAALDANKKAIEGLTQEAKKNESAFKKLDISAVIPLIKSANSLGVVSRAVGVDLQKVQDILLLAFRQGKITLEEYNKQLKETEDNLGAGIPNAVGAVSTAFQNLIDAGTKGGEFSIDAFSDIFAEFREKFENEGSAFRQQQRASLLQALEDAKKAAETAVGPDAAKRAQEALKAAQKALDDFYATIPAPSLADLRSELEKSFSGDQVNAFFQALDESGLNSFDQLAGAGPEAITKILARMQELGFSFGQTSEEIAGIIGGLNDASNAANGNKDPIQEALDLIKQFNEGANALPPAFDKTNEAVNGLSGTLATLNAGFDGIIEKLSELSGLEFRNTIIFDVKTEGGPGAEKLVEILFGNGSTTTTGTGNGDTGTGGGGGATTNTPGPSLSRLKRKLRRLVAAGKGNTQEAKDLRRKIREMEGN